MTGKFADFYLSLDPDSAKRGRQFEQFVKWFLTADPEWSTQVDQVWLWSDYPDRWGADCGIDLVFRHRNGEHWAVQAKCYSPDHDITKHDVDKFLSESHLAEGAKHFEATDPRHKQVANSSMSLGAWGNSWGARVWKPGIWGDGLLVELDPEDPDTRSLGVQISALKLAEKALAIIEKSVI